MEKPAWGDILTIGITTSGMISIEFYDPSNEDIERSSILLTKEQALLVGKLVEMIDGQAT